MPAKTSSTILSSISISLTHHPVKRPNGLKDLTHHQPKGDLSTGGPGQIKIIKFSPLVLSRCCCCWSCCCCCFCSCFCCCHGRYYRPCVSKNNSSRSRSRSSSSSSSSSSIWMRPEGKFLFWVENFRFPGTAWAWESLFVFPNGLGALFLFVFVWITVLEKKIRQLSNSSARSEPFNPWNRV